MRKYFKFCAIILTSGMLASCDVLTQLPANGTGTMGSTTQNKGITQTEAAGGIKEALQWGLQESVKSLSAQNGYFGNSAVKILLPEEAQNIERTLRSVGLGSVVDDLILNLNRAAETAVGEASSVFISSLSQLKVQDAFNILLSGQSDAATQFFKRTTTQELTQKFLPIVESAIGKHQVAKYWNTVITQYNALPLGTQKIEADLNQYVTQKAIEGLFVKVAEEELKIRNNISGSRTSPLVKKVFDYADQQKTP